KQLCFAALMAVAALGTTGCSSAKKESVAANSALPKLTNDVHWFRNAAEHKAVYAQTYADAAEELERLAAGKTPGTWAVSLDADETVLDNSQYQKELLLTGDSYSDETWNQWCERREARALPGSKAYLEKVRALGGKIVIVSNRYTETQQATEDNLRQLELPFDLVMLRQGKPDKQKERRWNEVTSGTTPAGWPAMPILQYLGDNIEDFPELEQGVRTQGEAALAPFGKTYFAFPNPMYGSWPANPQD
ncbi:MAG: HAD family acid phosphatase, partial [Candidatus Sumerlaeia bacterium]|nr:HAD family acid phosphatase [Candidatus Sumerlaeia bacterium]